MKDWDDIRYFLAVARNGSVRAAAASLGVNHSTVIRRVTSLEDRLGTHVFDKLPSGYRPTEAGTQILELAEQMESASAELETRVFGRDQSLSGVLRVALPSSLATDLLMPDLAAFANRHPGIELEVMTSHEPVNLTMRQADVAIRLVFDRANLPDHLIGIELADVYRAVYVSRDLAEQPEHALRWLLKAEDGPPPDWATPAHRKVLEPALSFTELQAQLAAAEASMGMAVLPCFVGDGRPELTRMPGGQTQFYGTLWLLTLDETRKTRRVRLFLDFITEQLKSHAAQGIFGKPSSNVKDGLNHHDQ